MKKIFLKCYKLIAIGTIFIATSSKAQNLSQCIDNANDIQNICECYRTVSFNKLTTQYPTLIHYLIDNPNHFTVKISADESTLPANVLTKLIGIFRSSSYSESDALDQMSVIKPRKGSSFFNYQGCTIKNVAGRESLVIDYHDLPNLDDYIEQVNPPEFIQSDEQKKLLGRVRDKQTGAWLNGISIKLLDKDGSELSEIQTNSKGEFSFTVGSDVEGKYLVSAIDDNESYNPTRRRTYDKNIGQDGYLDLYMERTSAEEVVYSNSNENNYPIKRENRPKRPIKGGRVTGELLADPGIFDSEDINRVLITLDGSGSMWQTTGGPLSSNWIISLLLVGDQIFVGTRRGLDIMDTAGNFRPNTLTTANGLPSNKIASLLQVGDQIFMGTDQGVAIINMDTISNVKPKIITTVDGLWSNDIYSLLQVGDQIFVGTGLGVSIMDTEGNVRPNTQIITDDGFSKNTIYSLLQVGDQILMGTRKGISIRDITGTIRQKTITTVDGLLSNDIYSLLQVGDQIFVGTRKGISIMDITGTIRQKTITTVDGLLSNDIYSLLQVGDQILVGTTEGIAFMEKIAGKWEVISIISNSLTYFHLACDAALNTLDLMDSDTKVSVAITLYLEDRHPIVLGAWSDLSSAKARIAKLRAEATQGNLMEHFAQGGFVLNPGLEEGMAPILKAAKTIDEKPDLMLFMHDGGLDETMQAEIDESSASRDFPIHFKPFGAKDSRYQTYFGRVPQQSKRDVILPHDF